VVDLGAGGWGDTANCDQCNEVAGEFVPTFQVPTQIFTCWWAFYDLNYCDPAGPLNPYALLVMLKVDPRISPIDGTWRWKVNVCLSNTNLIRPVDPHDLAFCAFGTVGGSASSAGNAWATAYTDSRDCMVFADGDGIIPLEEINDGPNSSCGGPNPPCTCGAGSMPATIHIRPNI
jgi:hypothetical protein